MKILWIFFGAPQKGSFLWILKSFLKGKVKNGGYFLGFLTFQTFFGVPEIPDIFLGERYMLGPSLRIQKKLE